jgi:hypothetical protein
MFHVITQEKYIYHYVILFLNHNIKNKSGIKEQIIILI